MSEVTGILRGTEDASVGARGKGEQTTVPLDRFDNREKDAFEGYDEVTASRAHEWLARLSQKLRVEVRGLENVPRGRALLVANHPFGWDIALAVNAIHAATGRRVWTLGEHLWWVIPGLRKLAAKVGVVDGTPENVDRLLQADELVLVLPGGLREAVKPRELRYRLLWGHRYGFVRAAIRNRAPIVPVASFGADGLFDFVGDPYARGARWLKKPRFPVPLPRRLLPIPHRVHLAYAIGEPIPADLPLEAAGDPVALRRRRREVEGALHELIEDELARRAGMSM